jgi:AcrR family transcriptional regulator
MERKSVPPRTATHEETRQKLLKTARHLVLKRGHEGLSLREIARAAGFSPAALYEYFDGRDAIVAALAREAAGSLKLALDRSLRGEDGKGSAEPLAQLGLAYVAWAQAHAEDFLLLFQRLPSKRRSTREDPPADSPYGVVFAAVRRAEEAGRVRSRGKESTERLAYGLWAAAHGMAMLQLTHLAGFDTDFRAADAAVFEAIFRGWTG